MGPGTALKKRMIWKYPVNTPTTAVVGDSQTKYIHQYFDPLCNGAPAFISQSGATIGDVRDLLDLVPRSASCLILHVGTTDVASSSGHEAFAKYRDLLESIAKDRPEIRRIYATLILPRSGNRRQRNRNLTFVRRCNKEASVFNDMLRNFCRYSRLVRYLDHEIEWLPPARVLAADGLHLSFEGVSLLASHIRHLCFRRPADATSTAWCDSSTNDAPHRVGRAWQPSARSHPTAQPNSRNNTSPTASRTLTSKPSERQNVVSKPSRAPMNKSQPTQPTSSLSPPAVVASLSPSQPRRAVGEDDDEDFVVASVASPHPVLCR
ncbi:hypothetical protein HPB52_025198 [Rhipicephalus sanguineus]|uniref:Uncharacterized protein n=1 Tax=Rhipicephalus sanguineus TaxID=34632 RepID=A0A9D4TCH2_RHISA|nr:hypothetical protein HPB52_024400 [Rhipicephalus sanguineus]KAH7986124.1 hypothetical protein HPB52_025198 [Rhipicephalus sanguineus]